MSVSEADLDLLDSYLDDELSFAEADELRERLGSDAELSLALERLRGQREMRLSLWRGMEPDQKSAQQFAWRLRGQMRREARWGRWMHGTRIAAATAACLLVGIMVGRGGIDPALPISDEVPGGNMIWQANPISAQAQPQPQPPAQRLYRVSLTDSSGRVVAVQHFGSIVEAREFAQDVGRWQQKHRQVRSGNVRLVAEEF